ncbi:MAG: Holliday junction branch migration protein RuvA [Thermodesulfobacteriota bacterium]
MIACLKGTLLHKGDEEVEMLVGGVGYLVAVPRSCLETLPPAGTEILLHVHTQVREDAITLFGFADRLDREMFLLLGKVTGVGPRLALALLSGLPTPALARAIQARDLHRLTRISGIGKKIAERLCLELADKVLPFLAAGPAAPAAGAGEATGEDLVSALVNLGYPAVRAKAALEALRQELGAEVFLALPLPELIRRALRSLA